MAEQDLQHLIDRIRREAIGEAEAEAERIVAGAREKAAATVKTAEEEAKAKLEKADEDAKQFDERSRRTLEQAARDLLITVGQGVENILSDLVEGAVDEAYDHDLLKEMLLKTAEAYAAADGRKGRIELLLNEKDQEALVDFFRGRYRESLGEGVEIHTDNGILKGFRIGFEEATVRHDFTREAIAEALSVFLRPHLSEIVHRAARGTSNDNGKDAGDGAEGGKAKGDGNGKDAAAGNGKAGG